MWGRTFRTLTPTLLTLTLVPAGVSKPLLITIYNLAQLLQPYFLFLNPLMHDQIHTLHLTPSQSTLNP